MIDAAVLARPYEELTYWDLMGRATRMRLVLVGYFQLPKSSDEAVEFDINPATGTIRYASTLRFSLSLKLFFAVLSATQTRTSVVVDFRLDVMRRIRANFRRFF